MTTRMSNEEEMFPLSALLYNREHAEDKDYWKQFGIEQVELPEGCSRVAAVWDRVCLRFNETYYDRFLAGETMEQWQRRLQVTTDFTVPRIDRAMKMYSDYADGIHDDISASQKTVYDVTDSGTSSSETKVSDTPDTLINESQDYAGSVSQGSGATGNVKTGSVTTEIRGGGGTLENVNANVDAWRDLESQLVAEYAKAFLSLVWY